MTKVERAALRTAGRCIGALRCEAPRVEGHERCRNHMRWNLKPSTRQLKEGKPLTFGGETLLRRQWAERLNVSEQALHWRLAHWPLERALTTVGALSEWHRSYTPASERLLQVTDGPRCGRCDLLEPHECVMAIELFAIHQAQGKGDASSDFSGGRKGHPGRSSR